MPYFHQPVTTIKTAIANRRHEKMIKQSQKKIGEYTPPKFKTIYA